MDFIVKRVSMNGTTTPEIDLGDSVSAIGFYIPSNWTGTSMTFLAADAPEAQGGTYRNVYTSAGLELNVTVTGGALMVDIPELNCVRWLKIRGGTAASPVNQVLNIDILIRG